VVDEALEDAVVVEQFVAGLVVHLEADDRGVAGVAADDLADDPLGVEPERRVGEVDLLPAPQGMRAGARSPAISGYCRASHGGTA
jgi:hypothetical protein